MRRNASSIRLIAPTIIGFTGLALLGRPGELIRPYLIARRENLSFSSQIAVWAVERIFDIGAFTILLIAAAFVTLVQFNPSMVPAWMAVVIIGREFLVSGLRSIAASEGFTIEASDLGKFKMFVQIVSVVGVILAHRWKEWPVYGNFFFPVHTIAAVSIWFMVVLSLVSAGDYFAAFWSKIDRRVVKRRRRAFVLSRRRKRDVAAT